MRATTVVATASLLLTAGCVAMQPSVVEPAEYLGEQLNPPAIYQAGGSARLLPVFDVRFDPMNRLMLVNFGDDPVYEGIELQTFPADDEGESVLALLWRRDKVVDVYMSRNHRMDEVQRRGLENLLNRITLQRAEFDYRLEVTEHGLDAALQMRDREGREVSFEVVETAGEPAFGALIAPVGAVVERPGYLPIVFLDDFALVRRRGTRIRVTVDGQERTPEKMTRLVKGPASYFTRYSTRVVIANWNERREATIEPVPLRQDTREVEIGNLTWRIRWNGDHPEVEAIVAQAERGQVTFLFSPALPDLARLREGALVEGRFVINVNAVEGITAGEYRVSRGRGGVRIEIQPLRAWQPPILKGPPWVASYHYQADLDLSGSRPQLRSEWRRLGRE